MTTRFSDRVQDYVRYRPTYAQAAIDLIVRELGLGPDTTIADLGAGTGILTRQLAPTGTRIVAIDPSEPMLEAARAELEAGDRIHYRVASAEDTGLPDASVHGIVVGQAFHWFDPERVAAEARRILCPGGSVALMWNVKAFAESAFLRDYEQLLETDVPEFAQVRHETTGDAEIDAFFGSKPAIHEFPHGQHFHWESTLGRAVSSSYAPGAGTAARHEFEVSLRELFDRHQVDGIVDWPYVSTVYVGTLD